MTTHSLSDHIVSLLIEAEEPDEFDVSKLTPDEFKLHVAKLVDAYDAEQSRLLDLDILPTFKRKVKGYIEWIASDPEVYDSEDVRHDLARVAKAKTFEEVKARLAEYEDSELTFLHMISLGYF